ncbi:MAG: hypothetical protein H7244_09030, partial [Herminiimonas sp.]|nr:hypothetical protein [Herminiimonas sp.]
MARHVASPRLGLRTNHSCHDDPAYRNRYLFALLAGLALAGAAGAQSPGQNPEAGKVGAAPPAVVPPATVRAPALVPNVESVDILKQNQAERTRDQPG